VSGTSAPADIDALFQVPLGEFTSARNALAAQLKRDGRVTEASEAKALAKPSVSAWVVNQLFWRHRKLFGRLIESGDRMRRAHAEPRSRGSAPSPADVRREVVAELAALAEKLLQEAGHGGTRDLIRRVTSTLDALSSYGSLPNAPAAGRLTDDLQPPGFAAVLSVLPAAGKPTANRPPTQPRLPAAQPVAKPTKRAHEEAAAARRAEEERKRAAAAAAAKAAVLAGERALSATRKDAERATQAAADAERALSAARKEAERATQSAADAERALELARRELAKYSR
jgi:hypothetical protein